MTTVILQYEEEFEEVDVIVLLVPVYVLDRVPAALFFLRHLREALSVHIIQELFLLLLAFFPFHVTLMTHQLF